MKRLMILFGAMILVACGPPQSYEEARVKSLKEAMIEVILEDGTRCVAFVYGYSGGLDCEFSK